GERQVAGQNDGGVFVAGCHELEEQVGGVLFEGQVADFVDDDQPVAAQPFQLVGETVGSVCFGQAGDPAGGGVEGDAVTGPGRDDTQRGGEVGFAGAGRAEQHHVAGLGQKRSGRQGGDRATRGALLVEVDVFQGFSRGEAGCFDADLGAGGGPGGDFPVQDRGEIV